MKHEYWFQKPCPQWGEPLADNLVFSLRELMNSYTIEGLSIAVGVHHSTIQRWITGKSMPSKMACTQALPPLKKLGFDISTSSVENVGDEKADGSSNNPVSSHNSNGLGGGAGPDSGGKDFKEG